MSGQSANMSRQEVVSKLKAVECSVGNANKPASSASNPEMDSKKKKVGY